MISVSTEDLRAWRSIGALGEPEVEYVVRSAADTLALRIERAGVNDTFDALDEAGLPDDRHRRGGRAAGSPWWNRSTPTSAASASD